MALIKAREVVASPRRPPGCPPRGLRGCHDRGSPGAGGLPPSCPEFRFKKFRSKGRLIGVLRRGDRGFEIVNAVCNSAETWQSESKSKSIFFKGDPVWEPDAGKGSPGWKPNTL